MINYDNFFILLSRVKVRSDQKVIEIGKTIFDRKITKTRSVMFSFDSLLWVWSLVVSLERFRSVSQIFLTVLNHFVSLKINRINAISCRQKFAKRDCIICKWQNTVIIVIIGISDRWLVSILSIFSIIVDLLWSTSQLPLTCNRYVSHFCQLFVNNSSNAIIAITLTSQLLFFFHHLLSVHFLSFMIAVCQLSSRWLPLLLFIFSSVTICCDHFSQFPISFLNCSSYK